jgi:hypothetical protein
MVEESGVHRVVVGQRLLGRECRTWEDNIKMNFQYVSRIGGDWMKKQHD